MEGGGGGGGGGEEGEEGGGGEEEEFINPFRFVMINTENHEIYK